MTTSGQKSLSSIGFLTISRDVEHGLFGGFLVLNTVGRPLEFHCTAPVRPNRAQEILYGPTLDSYLCGERISPTLLQKAKARPRFVLTDIEPAMDARQLVDVPLVLLLPPPAAATAAEPPTPPDACFRLDRAHGDAPPHVSRWRPFRVGRHHLATDYAHLDDERVVSECWPELAHQIDLEEPFERIREAIEEARRGGERVKG